MRAPAGGAEVEGQVGGLGFVHGWFAGFAKGKRTRETINEGSFVIGAARRPSRRSLLACVSPLRRWTHNRRAPDTSGPGAGPRDSPLLAPSPAGQARRHGVAL